METRHDSFEIVVADNASTDGTGAWLAEHFPSIKHARFEDNFGYCGGNNRGAKHAEGEFLIFLNNDVSVEPGWLAALDACLSKHPERDILQPKLRDWNQPEMFEYAGAAGGFIDIMGYAFCRGRLFDTLELDVGQYDTDRPIFWASGAALLIRASAFESLGGFEERFEFHMEEIDLCWRAWNAGFQVWTCGRSRVFHLGGGSLARTNVRKVFYNFRNNLFLLARNLPLSSFLWRLLPRLCLDGLAGLKFLLEGKPGFTWAIVRAHFSFYASFNWVFSSVKGTKRRFGSIPGVYSGLVLQSYFFGYKKTFDALTAERFG